MSGAERLPAAAPLGSSSPRLNCVVHLLNLGNASLHSDSCGKAHLVQEGSIRTTCSDTFVIPALVRLRQEECLEFRTL